MMKLIRTKFEVTLISKDRGVKQVTLKAKEGDLFWKDTPKGEIKLEITNQQTPFEVGEYYIDFIKINQ